MKLSHFFSSSQFFLVRLMLDFHLDFSLEGTYFLFEFIWTKFYKVTEFSKQVLKKLYYVCQRLKTDLQKIFYFLIHGTCEYYLIWQVNEYYLIWELLIKNLELRFILDYLGGTYVQSHVSLQEKERERDFSFRLLSSIIVW